MGNDETTTETFVFNHIFTKEFRKPKEKESFSFHFEWNWKIYFMIAKNFSERASLDSVFFISVDHVFAVEIDVDFCSP